MAVSVLVAKYSLSCWCVSWLSWGNVLVCYVAIMVDNVLRHSTCMFHTDVFEVMGCA